MTPSPTPTSVNAAPRATPWSQPFQVMAKPVGARCNLQCRYCYYLEKEPAFYPGPGMPRMSDETLEKFVRDYLASQPGEEVAFAWQGGEPTLAGLPFFERALEHQRLYGAGRRIVNSLQTNGTLLDDAWGEFLAKNHFLVGLSLDGPRTMHDGYRVDRGGRPTWEKVMRGLRVLKKHRVEFNTLTVVHRRNYRHALEVYDFLGETGSGFMQFIPLVELKPSAAEKAAQLDHGQPVEEPARLIPPDRVEAAVADECAPPEGFGEFLGTIFDRWVRRDVGRVFVQHFDVALNAWVGQTPPLCVFQERCGRALVLEHNGDLYACDHFVFPRHLLGNVHQTPLADLGNDPATARFGAAKANLPRMCLDCPVRFACNGDCPKHRFVCSEPGGPGVSYLCASYRRFFTHIDPAMRRMAALVCAGRPADEIMAHPGQPTSPSALRPGLSS